jgi:hypothetical protein
MKRLVLMLATLMTIPVAPVLASPCLPGTLQDYVNLGMPGCEAGVASFSGFVVLPGEFLAMPVDPDTITVTPVGGAFNPGLQFGINTLAIAGELFESFFRFTVAGELSAASLLLGPGTVTGDGAAIAVEDLCVNGSFVGNDPLGCSGSADTAIVARTETSEFLLDQKPIIGGFFDILVDISIDGGLAGTASLDNVTVQFVSPVPEPSTGLLLAGGFVLLGLLYLRCR